MSHLSLAIERNIFFFFFYCKSKRDFSDLSRRFYREIFIALLSWKFTACHVLTGYIRLNRISKWVVNRAVVGFKAIFVSDILVDVRN